MATETQLIQKHYASNGDLTVEKRELSELSVYAHKK